MSFETFRSTLVAQVPGIPPSAAPEFDITRHGILGHVQRVGVRALALDLNPHLDPLAVDGARTLGDLASLVGPIEGVVRGRDRATHQTSRVRLEPVSPSDVGLLYRAATVPGDGFRWRFRGRTPSFEEFSSTLFGGVVCQFIVQAPRGESLGLVVAYDEDGAARHCSIGMLRISEPGTGSSGAILEGLVLFIDYLFKTFPYHKLFADLPEYNLPLIAGLPEDVLRPEGRQTEFFWHAGRTWDRCFYSISRAAWEPIAAALAP